VPPLGDVKKKKLVVMHLLFKNFLLGKNDGLAEP
jgi:hypothetical protein